MARRRGSQLDGEFAFYASRHRRRARPGWDGGGARSWTRSSAAFHAPRRQLRAWPGVLRCLGWSLPFYLSLTGLSTGGQAVLGHWPNGPNTI